MFAFTHNRGVYHPELMFIFGGASGGGQTGDWWHLESANTAIYRYDGTGNSSLTGKYVDQYDSYGCSSTSLNKKVFIYRQTTKIWDGATLSAARLTYPNTSENYFGCAETLGSFAYNVTGGTSSNGYIYKSDESTTTNLGSLIRNINGNAYIYGMDARTLGSNIYFFGGDMSSNYLYSTIKQFDGTTSSVNSANYPMIGGYYHETYPATVKVGSAINVFCANTGNYKKVGSFDGTTYSELSTLLASDVYNAKACTFNSVAHVSHNDGNGSKLSTWNGTTLTLTGWTLKFQTDYVTQYPYGFTMSTISK